MEKYLLIILLYSLTFTICRDKRVCVCACARARACVCVCVCVCVRENQKSVCAQV
jgi:hypothetical protein